MKLAYPRCFLVLVNSLLVPQLGFGEEVPFVNIHNSWQIEVRLPPGKQASPHRNCLLCPVRARETPRFVVSSSMWIRAEGTRAHNLQLETACMSESVEHFPSRSMQVVPARCTCRGFILRSHDPVPCSQRAATLRLWCTPCLSGSPRTTSRKKTRSSFGYVSHPQRHLHSHPCFLDLVLLVICSRLALCRCLCTSYPPLPALIVYGTAHILA